MSGDHETLSSTVVLYEARVITLVAGDALPAVLRVAVPTHTADPGWAHSQKVVAPLSRDHSEVVVGAIDLSAEYQLVFGHALGFETESELAGILDWALAIRDRDLWSPSALAERVFAESEE